ncbi:hypothetical protein SUDANB95_07818 [Actinosynnema sp. ALI-1.44]
MPAVDYDRRAFARLHLDAHDACEHGSSGMSGYDAALRAHRKAVLEGLRRLFDLDLRADPLHRMVFESTARSYGAIRSPFSGYGEIGLLERVLGAEGLAPVERIVELNAASKEAHVDFVVNLLASVRPGAEVFTSDDLRAIGVDDTPPGREGHEYDW